MNGRNELYPDPFDEFDPHHKIKGKKAFNDTVRCLQSRIDLSIINEDIKQKLKQKITVSQKAVEDFDKMYAENCNNK